MHILGRCLDLPMPAHGDTDRCKEHNCTIDKSKGESITLLEENCLHTHVLILGKTLLRLVELVALGLLGHSIVLVGSHLVWFLVVIPNN